MDPENYATFNFSDILPKNIILLPMNFFIIWYLSIRQSRYDWLYFEVLLKAYVVIIAASCHKHQFNRIPSSSPLIALT